MKIATWNVNGIRARSEQLHHWIAEEQPDVLCIQEIKAASDQVPTALCEMEGYWCCWHGQKGYSGVGMHIRKAVAPEPPSYSFPDFDFECRIMTTVVQGITIASVYVPNGGKDMDAKMRFLTSLEAYAEASADRPIVLCGDMNVIRSDRDVHPKELKPGVIGQLPVEREAMERILSHGLVDVQRSLHPDDDRLFTWWAPWRELRQKNVGWRIDYILASRSLEAGACEVYREVGTSDHAPLVATFDTLP